VTNIDGNKITGVKKCPASTNRILPDNFSEPPDYAGRIASLKRRPGAGILTLPPGENTADRYFMAAEKRQMAQAVRPAIRWSSMWS